MGRSTYRQSLPSLCTGVISTTTEVVQETFGIAPATRYPIQSRNERFLVSRACRYRQSCRRRKIMFRSPRGRRHLLGAAQLIPPALHPITHPPGRTWWEFYDIYGIRRWLFPVAAIWNDRLGSALIQFLAQFGAVVCLVAKHPFRRLYSADQALRDRAIMRFTSSQQDGEKAPFSICECVYLRVAPSARAANSLLLLPPFPPAAERCAFTCVESIICVSVDRPFPASSRNRFSQTPRRAQRTKRL